MDFAVVSHMHVRGFVSHVPRATLCCDIVSAFLTSKEVKAAKLARNPISSQRDSGPLLRITGSRTLAALNHVM